MIKFSSRQGGSQESEISADTEESPLHLKRLLVTMKQHYEKRLTQERLLLQDEQHQRSSLQKQLEECIAKLAAKEACHDEELASLRSQQNTLKELLKSAQQECQQLKLSQDERKTALEASLKDKESEWVKGCQEQQKQQAHIDYLSGLLKEKETLQDKYEQLKEEWKSLSESVEELGAEKENLERHITVLSAKEEQKDEELVALSQENARLQQESRQLLAENERLKNLLEEMEGRFRTAQQHLAKRVKEASLLSERAEESQANLVQFAQIVELQKGEIAKLQATIEIYEKQEKRLQEQLHEALKGTESKIIKWEEKYFQIYEKWQEGENKIRELKKVEEKHLQMQHLLANFGQFMGGTFKMAPTQETEPLTEASPPPQASNDEEKWDLFGMRLK